MILHYNDSADYLPTEEGNVKEDFEVNEDPVIKNTPTLFIDKFLLTDDKVLMLAELLRKESCQIQSLIVLTNTFGYKNLRFFCESLKQNKSLRELVFSQIKVVGDDLDVLFDSLKQNDSIETIRLIGVKMDTERCQNLVSFLK